MSVCLNPVVSDESGVGMFACSNDLRRKKAEWERWSGGVK